MKQALLAVAIIGLLIRVYFLYHGAQTSSAPKPSTTQQLVDQSRRAAQGPADAGETGVGRPAVARNTAPPATGADPAAKALEAERQEIETALKGMHLTTIMPGQPGLVIIDKQEYSEGEALALPKGRQAKIVAVQDDGVQLSCDNMAFRLEAPTGPDLAALRKKKN